MGNKAEQLWDFAGLTIVGSNISQQWYHDTLTTSYVDCFICHNTAQTDMTIY